MTRQEIEEYYDTTENREIRPDLTLAVKNVGEPKIAIDCGCGAGADIKYLLAAGFKVYGFDIEEESISRCKERFKNNGDLVLSKADFNSYKYPRASLVVADASLFFCPENDFEPVWRKIHECLCSNGIFCGSFLGPEDTMASANNNQVFWDNALVFHEVQVKSLFRNDYEIISFTEHKSSGKNPNGLAHDWHVFSVVARKLE